MWFSMSGWPHRTSQHLRFFFQDISMQFVFSCKTFVWSVLFYWIPHVSIHVLPHDSIKLIKLGLSHPGLFWSSGNTHIHIYIFRQTQTSTPPPFSNAETAHWVRWRCVSHSAQQSNINSWQLSLWVFSSFVTDRNEHKMRENLTVNANVT